MQRSVLIWAIGLALLAALTLACVRYHVPQIEADILERSSSALRDAGITQINVDRVEGLDVFLSGTAVPPEIGDRAIQLVGGLPGVRSVHTQFVNEVVSLVPVVAPPDRFVAAFDGRQLTLTGAVRDSAARASLVGFARRVFEDVHVVDELTTSASVPGTWSTASRAVLEQLVRFNHGRFELFDKSVSLSGSASTEAAREDARSAVSERLGDQYSMDFEVSVESPGRAQAVQCQSRINDLLRGESVRFNTGSDVILIDSHPLLEELVAILFECADFRIEVQGHTDSLGDPRNNQMLSDQRAEAVVRYLRDEGVDPKRMTARGYGSTRPVAENNTADGRAKNRRLEVVILED